MPPENHQLIKKLSPNNLVTISFFSSTLSSTKMDFNFTPYPLPHGVFPISFLCILSEESYCMDVKSPIPSNPPIHSSRLIIFLPSGLVKHPLTHHFLSQQALCLLPIEIGDGVVLLTDEHLAKYGGHFVCLFVCLLVVARGISITFFKKSTSILFLYREN